MITDEENKERFEYATTHSAIEFAEHFNLTTGYAEAWYSKHNLPRRKKLIFKKYTKEEFLELIEGKTSREVSEITGKPTAVLYKVAKELGIKYIKKAKWGERIGDKTRMIAFLSTRFSYNSIAEMLGVSRQYVCECHQKYGADFEKA